MKQHIQFTLRALRFAALTLVAMGLTPLPASAQFRGRESTDWVSVWGASPSSLDCDGCPNFTHLSGKTIREHVRLSLGGNRIRIRLSSRFGGDVVIGAVHVALHAGGANTLPGTDRTVAFSDQPSVTIPAGAQVVSDEIALDVRALDEIAVSIYVAPESLDTRLTTHGTLTTSNTYASGLGDFTATAMMPVERTLTSLYLLSAVEVRQATAVSVVTLGDDITNGRGSTTDANHRWPDYLADRLRSQQNATPGVTPVAVVNAGIDYNRLLDTIRVGAVTTTPTGPSAVARLDADVIAQSHLKWVTVFQGINDISGIFGGTPRTFKEIIGAYKQLIARAHGAGLKIYGCTLIPANFTADKEQFRQDVNSWIRNSGQFDAVIDFDAAIRDPSNGSQILPAYDSGGHRYPNDLGHFTMANAVPLALFGDE
jgi:lysophospholipase L1-like esterase